MVSPKLSPSPVAYCRSDAQHDTAVVTKSARKRPTKLIRPQESPFDLRLLELWHHRELIGLLAWRDFVVRYKQTILGSVWAVLQPVGMMICFTLVFRRLAHVPSEGVPYPLFIFVGLLSWQYFASALSSAATSLLKNAHILTKVHFPRLVIPISAALPPLMDFCLGFAGLIVVLMVSGIMPTWRWLVIPALLLEILVLALAVGIWLAAASVRYRDVSQCLPFLTQLWMFATPVVYPGNLVPTRWQTLYMANPMVSISEHFRWAILNTNTNLSCNWFISVLVTLAVLIGGIVYFRHVERTMADYI